MFGEEKVIDSFHGQGILWLPPTTCTLCVRMYGKLSGWFSMRLFPPTTFWHAVYSPALLHLPSQVYHRECLVPALSKPSFSSPYSSCLALKVVLAQSATCCVFSLTSLQSHPPPPPQFIKRTLDLFHSAAPTFLAFLPPASFAQPCHAVGTEASSTA